MISEGVTEVAWTGGPLADAHVAQFGMSMKMPDKAGETVYFKTIQTCEQGETAGDESDVAAQPGAVEDDDDTDPLTFVAPAFGVAGFLFGGLAWRRRI